MNFFDADGMLKIGNVELKFLVDFEKNGDMLLWKTQKQNGFIYTKSIVGVCACKQDIRMLTTYGAMGIDCDTEETAQKILNIITSINVKLYAGKKLGAYNLETIGDDCVKSKDGCCGECSYSDKDEETKDFVKLMDGMVDHFKKQIDKLRGNE